MSGEYKPALVHRDQFTNLTITNSSSRELVAGLSSFSFVRLSQYLVFVDLTIVPTAFL